MAKRFFKPQRYVKSTIYIASGAEGKSLVKALNEDMKRMDLDFSPLMVKAYTLYHDLDKDIETQAERQGLKPSELINRAVRAYVKIMEATKQ